MLTQATRLQPLDDAGPRAPRRPRARRRGRRPGTDGDAVERVGDERVDVEEADAAGQERGHRLLVRGVQDAGRGAAGLARGARQREAAEGRGVRRLEVEREARGRRSKRGAAVAARSG